MRHETFRSSRLSLLQSCVAEQIYAKDPGAKMKRNPTPHPYMQAIIRAGHRYKHLRPGDPLPPIPRNPSPEPLPTDVAALDHCTHALLQLIFGNLREKTEALVILSPFGTCDAGWISVLAAYMKFWLLSGKIPYIAPRALTDSRLEVLPERCRIGIIGDWGTGTELALEVLTQVARFRDQEPAVAFILLHLGDVYYSGIAPEYARFVEQCRQLFPKEPIFTLSGNHDMYCGGKPFYDTIATLNEPPFVQKTSYFCLRNRFWQFQAMDTGLHDRDAFEPHAPETFLEPEEVKWQQAQLNDSGSRKVVIVSHHPPFSAFSSIGREGSGDVFVNKRLLSTFDGSAPDGDRTNHLKNVVLWLFGHEHSSIIYKPSHGVERGRCIGSSAIPAQADDNPYKVATKTIPWHQDIQLALKDDLYSHGYAVMDIDGTRGTISYYQYPAPAGQDLLYKEDL
jgi:hypothetical protein